MNNLIVITKDNTYKLNNYKELYTLFLGEDYFNLDKEAQIERIKQKAKIYSLQENFQLASINDNYDKEKPYILIDNEINYILSIIKLYNILILENRNSNIFIKDFMKQETQDNYFIINNYIDKILYKEW